MKWEPSISPQASADRTPTASGASGGGPGQGALTQRSRYRVNQKYFKSRAEELVVSPHNHILNEIFCCRHPASNSRVMFIFKMILNCKIWTNSSDMDWTRSGTRSFSHAASV